MSNFAYIAKYVNHLALKVLATPPADRSNLLDRLSVEWDEGLEETYPHLTEAERQEWHNGCWY